jgi:hypothetical protein
MEIIVYCLSPASATIRVTQKTTTKDELPQGK